MGEKGIELDPAAVRKVVAFIGGDGWALWAPEEFTARGLPQSFVDRFVTVHQSDRSSPKSTIWVDGRPVESVRGVYGLSLLEGLAAIYGIQSDKMGRGFRARDLSEGIRRVLDRGEA